MITDEKIENAKKQTSYMLSPHHEHNDCIRMAYQFLDAQETIKIKRFHGKSLKHRIESWCGRYVSQSDVEVAITLHEKLFGDYFNLNLSSKTTFPSLDRLKNISEAFKHRNYLESYDYDKKEIAIGDSVKIKCSFAFRRQILNEIHNNLTANAIAAKQGK